MSKKPDATQIILLFIAAQLATINFALWYLVGETF